MVEDEVPFVERVGIASEAGRAELIFRREASSTASVVRRPDRGATPDSRALPAHGDLRPLACVPAAPAQGRSSWFQGHDKRRVIPPGLIPRGLIPLGVDPYGALAYKARTPSERIMSFPHLLLHRRPHLRQSGAAGRRRRPAARRRDDERGAASAFPGRVRLDPHRLMFEPRGHDVMSGSILYPPTREDCDIAILFIETIGLPADVRPRHHRHGDDGHRGRAGQAEDDGRARLDMPAGLVDRRYKQDGELCRGGAHHQRAVLPLRRAADGRRARSRRDHRRRRLWRQFLRHRRAAGELSRHGRLLAGDILACSPIVRQRLNEKYDFVHPENPDITASPHAVDRQADDPEAHARNAVFYGDKAIDRSPCGTGTSARMAQLAAKGKLKVGDDFVHEIDHRHACSRAGSRRHAMVGKPAIIPSIGGWARMTGHNTIFIDDRDPFAHGFRAERRLTAILAADVAGYSRLMGADEEGTLAQLKAHRRPLSIPKSSSIADGS